MEEYKTSDEKSFLQSLKQYFTAGRTGAVRSLEPSWAKYGPQAACGPSDSSPQNNPTTVCSQGDSETHVPVRTQSGSGLTAKKTASDSVQRWFLSD